MSNDTIVVVSASRTPMGGMLGSLAPLTASQLGAEAIKATLERSRLNANDINEIYMGCVLAAGQGQAPARQAAIAAGIPKNVGATTINKMCGSGMKTVMIAHDLICANPQHMIIAGGMESMSNAPYLLPKAREGYRLGHNKVYDHMFLDGLEDAYDKGKLMGWFAEETAKKYQFSREAQDEFAITSSTRAIAAAKSGAFTAEMTAITMKTRKGEDIIDFDDGPRNAKLDKIPKLRAAFQENGTVTAANSSSISDGAAALLLMTESQANERKLQPLARIVAHASHAHEPEWFTTAPVTAIQNLLTKAKWNINDVDLFEINEAFALVTMAAIHDLKIPHEKVNIHGGACALGHPIGASGARILVTLIYALQQKKLKRGIAALCIGGGEATAMGVELL